MPQMQFSLFLFIEGGGCRWGVFFWRVAWWASLFPPPVPPFLSSRQKMNGTFAQQILMQIQALMIFLLISYKKQKYFLNIGETAQLCEVSHFRNAQMIL